MSVKKKQKALAALLSAMCSVTSAHAGESKKITSDQSSSNVLAPKNQGNNKNSKIQSATLGKNNLGLKKAGLGDVLSKNAGILFLGSAAIAGAAYNAKPAYDYFKKRSKNAELKKSASDIENLENEVNESEKRCNEIEEDKLRVTRNQIAMEGLLISTDNNLVNPVKLNKDSVPFTKLHDLDCKKLIESKIEKDAKDQEANDKFKESLNKLTDSLTGIMTKLGTSDDAFKAKLNSSLSNLKPQEGHGVIDLFKAILKSFEEAWCAASLENTKSDTDDTYNELNTQKARLEYFIDKYLELLLPMDKDTDDLPKNKNTRTVAIISHLFYKNDAPDQLTIEKFITNSFGDSLIVSKLSKHLQNIRTTFSKSDNGDFSETMKMYSPRTEKSLSTKIGNMAFLGLQVFFTKMFSSLNTISLSDAGLKNLFSSLVGQGVENNLLPKNCFQIVNNFNGTIDSVKSELSEFISRTSKLELMNYAHDDFSNLLSGKKTLSNKKTVENLAIDPSNNLLAILNDVFPEKKDDAPNPNKNPGVLDEFMKSQFGDPIEDNDPDPEEDPDKQKISNKLSYKYKDFKLKGIGIHATKSLNYLVEKYETAKTAGIGKIKDNDDKVYLRLDLLKENWNLFKGKSDKDIEEFFTHLLELTHWNLWESLTNEYGENYENAKQAMEYLTKNFKPIADNLEIVNCGSDDKKIGVKLTKMMLMVTTDIEYVKKEGA